MLSVGDQRALISGALHWLAPDGVNDGSGRTRCGVQTSTRDQMTERESALALLKSRQAVSCARCDRLAEQELDSFAAVSQLKWGKPPVDVFAVNEERRRKLEAAELDRAQRKARQEADAADRRDPERRYEERMRLMGLPGCGKRRR